MQPDMTSNQTLVRVERRSAAADVQSQLQALIESGRFKQHERLPSEVELARSFGVSRPVVREALMSLQALGLTASQSGKGTFVISDRVQAPLLIGHYSPAHIKEVRRALEIPSARFAALRRTDQDVGQLAAEGRDASAPPVSGLTMEGRDREDRSGYRNRGGCSRLYSARRLRQNPLQ